MSEITAEQAHLFVHNVVLGILKNESRTTRSVLAAVPNVNLDYRPDACAKTANELLRHIASADNFFLKSVVDGVFVPGSVKIPEDVKTPEEIVEWYAKEYGKNFDAVTKLSGEQLIKMVDFRGVFEQPAYTFLQTGLLHAVHHGASCLLTCARWAAKYRQFTAKATIPKRRKRLPKFWPDFVSGPADSLRMFGPGELENGVMSGLPTTRPEPAGRLRSPLG